MNLIYHNKGLSSLLIASIGLFLALIWPFFIIVLRRVVLYFRFSVFSLMLWNALLQALVWLLVLQFIFWATKI